MNFCFLSLMSNLLSSTFLLAMHRSVCINDFLEAGMSKQVRSVQSASRPRWRLLMNHDLNSFDESHDTGWMLERYINNKNILSCFFFKRWLILLPQVYCIINKPLKNFLTLQVYNFFWIDTVFSVLKFSTFSTMKFNLK